MRPGVVAAGDLISFTEADKSDTGQARGRIVVMDTSWQEINLHKYCLDYQRKGANKVYQITGGEAVTDAQVLNAIGKAIGKPIKYTAISPDAFKARLLSFGYPEGAASFVTTLETVRLNSWTANTVNTVEQVTGKKPLTAEQWAHLHAKEFTA